VGKAIRITYAECVFVALFIQLAKGVLWYAPIENIFFAKYLTNGTIFEGGKKPLNTKHVF
jgi:hypothetical protein